ncbi:MAG: hypothetical protein ABSH33_18530 [Steroidobacteraceae bacterium]
MKIDTSVGGFNSIALVRDALRCMRAYRQYGQKSYEKKSVLCYLRHGVVAVTPLSARNMAFFGTNDCSKVDPGLLEQA